MDYCSQKTDFLRTKPEQNPNKVQTKYMTATGMMNEFFGCALSLGVRGTKVTCDTMHG
jgi:hypothetical protein